ncbi:hypothetical protein CDCA_CDCA05G1543 [Cyanidium caldarium]|uniref:Uncharacterized protein n=1 Tax=Cyanidium caldarium TaxID=2771 RepID=A0AAV9IUJ8_CYACA|nr:hypothetical protein CDCA_CDCA05G1543 [Cyanidium caldarium]
MRVRSRSRGAITSALVVCVLVFLSLATCTACAQRIAVKPGGRPARNHRAEPWIPPKVHRAAASTSGSAPITSPSSSAVASALADIVQALHNLSGDIPSLAADLSAVPEVSAPPMSDAANAIPSAIPSVGANSSSSSSSNATLSQLAALEESLGNVSRRVHM